MNTQHAYETNEKIQEFRGRPAVAALILAGMTLGELYLVYLMIEFVVVRCFAFASLPLAMG